MIVQNLRVASVLVVLAAMTGCSSKYAIREHQNLRPKVQQLYEDQIWDNLVAVKEGGMPLHLHYYNFEGSGNSEVSLKYEYQDKDNFNTVPGAGPLTTIVELDEDGFGIDGTGKLGTSMKVSAQPAVGQRARKIFELYESFADQHVESGPRLPGGVLSFRERKGPDEGGYYFVPSHKKSEWRQFVIDTAWVYHSLSEPVKDLNPSPSKPAKETTEVETKRRTKQIGAGEEETVVEKKKTVTQS